MKEIIQKLLFKGRFLGVILFLSYVIVIQVRLVSRKVQWSWDILFPDAPFAIFSEALFLFFIIEIVHKYIPKQKTENQYFSPSVIILSFLLFIAISNVFSYFIALLFDTVEINFNQKVLVLINISRIINFTLFGTIYVTYRFFTENQAYKEKILDYNTKLSSAKIQNLRNQLNPHFLFNNLNILDQLIIENQEKASDFLNDFAELYRYSLETSDKKLVHIEEELDFVKKYFQLMQVKYESSYFLEIQKENTEDSYIPPLTLQLIIENIFNHNSSSPENPVKILLEIGSQIKITNNKTGKGRKKIPSGKSLNNLKGQYQLLTSEPIKIENNTDDFTVILPIIKQAKI